MSKKRGQISLPLVHPKTREDKEKELEERKRALAKGAGRDGCTEEVVFPFSACASRELGLNRIITALQ